MIKGLGKEYMVCEILTFLLDKFIWEFIFYFRKFFVTSCQSGQVRVLGC